jgi:hypothetical protein
MNVVHMILFDDHRTKPPQPGDRMNDVRTPREIDPRRAPRDERRMVALVAQYIHERSERHARARNGSRAKPVAEGSGD